MTPGAKREAVAHLCNAHGISQRCAARQVIASNHRDGACDVLQVDRSSLRYQSKRGNDAKRSNVLQGIVGGLAIAGSMSCCSVRAFT